MELNLIEFAGQLKELKLKREQVAQLHSEMSQLNILLIEKDSELQSKSSQCQLLEMKMIKYVNDSKQMQDNFNSQMRTLQLENSRLERVIADSSEKLRVLQMEKQCQALKVSHFEKEIKEIADHGQIMGGSLNKINIQQNNIIENVEAFEQQQVKLDEKCRMIQSQTERILKEAEEKWRIAQDLNAEKLEMEKKICSALAQIHVLENKVSEDAVAMQKQNECLRNQLQLSQQSEDKLRQELQKQRQEQLDQERRIQELMAKLANFISADSTEKQVL